MRVGTVKTIRMRGPRERNYTISHVENKTLEDTEKQSLEAHKTPRVEMIFRARARINPYRLSAEEINYQFKSAKIPSLIKRTKRFSCWHSCFGPFRKKEIRTLYGHPIQLFPTDTDSKPELGSRKRSVKLEEVPTNNELGEGGPNTSEPSQSGTANDKTLEANVTISLVESLEESDESQETTMPMGDANAMIPSTVHPELADSGEAKVKIRTIVDETIEQSEQIVPTTKQVIKSTKPLSTVAPTKETSTGTVSPLGKKSGEKSTPTKDDPNGKQGQQEDEYSYEDSEEDSDDDSKRFSTNSLVFLITRRIHNPMFCFVL